ncbi:MULTISPECIES: Sec-independent protein translocase subunit TatA [unclassified Streptomyces]|uniref:Sec-independent protein translocase subunit TatA n=1 Tax=unclassified Streptomyces TaxID=2593676 RepID=UPI002E2D326F|nr:Sec-independent protein translocase subunit TatA [Streptomyces sp. NBC_01439]
MFRNAVQPWHLLVLLVVCLLVFGSKKLPDMARSLGRSMRILKSEAHALRSEESPRDAGQDAGTNAPAVPRTGAGTGTP